MSRQEQLHIRHVSSCPSTTTTTTSNTAKSAPPKTKKVKTHPIYLHLYFAGRDLPEPDSRSRCTYVAIYNAYETPISQTKSNTTSIQHDPTIVSKKMKRTSSILSKKSSHHSSDDHSTNEQQQNNNSKQDKNYSTPKRGLRRSKSMTEAEAAVRHAQQQGHMPVTIKDKKSSNSNLVKRRSLLPTNSPKNPLSRANSLSTKLRTPEAAAVYTSPSKPTTTIRSDGVKVLRTGWMKLGLTEIAIKNGRDVEFSKGIDIKYSVDEPKQILRGVFFDVGMDGIHRLIGISEMNLCDIVKNDGKSILSPLKFVAVSRRDVKRREKIRDGLFIVTGEIRQKDDADCYRFDVECGKVLRIKALSTSSVKRVFYTIHGIINERDENCDEWILLARTNSVEMIHRKKDGGSLEYNYFSSRRLLAGPGLVVGENDGNDTTKYEEKNSSISMMEKISKALGSKSAERFFSLPGVDLKAMNENRRLKLSLWIDGGIRGVSEVIAETELKISELKKKAVGDAVPMKLHGNVVGRMSLKYTEYSSDPRYFCLSLSLQNGH